MPEPIVLNEGEDDEVRIPTSNEVCWRCRGDGTHDAWDGGMTQSDIAEQDDEFMENYMQGAYSVPCTECAGKRVLPVADAALCTPAQLAAWNEYQNDLYEDRALRAAERRAGC